MQQWGQIIEHLHPAANAITCVATGCHAMTHLLLCVAFQPG
jgi:hypothetical protein